MKKTTKQMLVGGLLLAIAGGSAFYLFRLLNGGTLKAPILRSVLDYPITAGAISSRFGKRSTGFHNGIDIRTRTRNGEPNLLGSADIGLRVYAPFDGIVDRIFTSEAGGLSMLIRSNDGFVMGFAHLLTTVVKEGERFTVGDILAGSGNSGSPDPDDDSKTYTPHLHLTLRNPAGELVDPAPFFGV